MAGKIEVYGDSISGNCYKIQLICAGLGIAHVWHELDLMQGAARSDEFRAMNPIGKVPLLKLADGRYERASIMSWLCFEQYSHEPYIATSRFIIRYLGNPPEQRQRLESKRDGGYRALDIMEGRLADNDFFANNRYSIADIALYAYTHVAHEGGFDLGKYKNIKAWFKRIEAQPGYIPMQA